MNAMPGHAQDRYAPQRWALAAALLLAPVLAGCANPVAKPRLRLPEPAPAATASIAMEQAQPALAPGPAAATRVAPVENLDLPEVYAAELDPSSQVAAVTTADRASEGYRTVGGVLAEVNGKPIFSEDLILGARNMLRGLAKQHPTREGFVREAKALLEQELEARIKNDLLRLAAERNLSANDRRGALMAATQFRSNRVTAAGGSEARARELALQQEGMTLEKLVEDTENRFLVGIFLQNVILPRARPSEAEIREYYLRHPEVSSTQGRGEVEFLLIELNGTGSSPEQLEARARHVHQLAEAGEDFAELARQHNDNPLYKQNAGAVPGTPLGRGDFRWPAVDEAVWNTPEGKVTPVISEDNGQRRFIAKVTRRSDPQTISFEAAQGPIRELIRSQRRAQLMGQYLFEAQQYAAKTPDEQIQRNLQTALEVVAQQYEQWRNE